MLGSSKRLAPSTTSSWSLARMCSSSWTRWTSTKILLGSPCNSRTSARTWTRPTITSSPKKTWSKGQLQTLKERCSRSWCPRRSLRWLGSKATATRAGASIFSRETPISRRLSCLSNYCTSEVLSIQIWFLNWESSLLEPLDAKLTLKPSIATSHLKISLSVTHTTTKSPFSWSFVKMLG